MVQFEWDPAKARLNRRKHGLEFEDAILVFDDPDALFSHDRMDETGELRWHAIGMIAGMSIVLVVHTVREEPDVIRLISARRATRQERSRYEQNRAKNFS